MDYLYVGIGGVFGVLLRYTTVKWVGRFWKGCFPLATFLINISGSLLIGYLTSGAIVLPAISLGNLVIIGFLGAFTTYSTFALETVNLLREGRAATAGGYFITSIITGLLMAYAGIMLGKFVISN